MKRSRRHLACWLVLAAGCNEPAGYAPADTDPPHDPPDRPDVHVPLAPADQAVRASMALRGVRPTQAELDAVRADPTRLGELVTVWLEDPGVGSTVRDLYAEVLRLRSVELVYPAIGPLLNLSQQQIRNALAEEPLALIEHIVRTDRPFTDIVTADTTFLDRTAARIWSNHTYDPAGPEVQQVRYTDGRPAGGILATNALWARHASAGANYHRGRANLVADALLCEDFLSRDVPIGGDVDLADDDAVGRALLDNPDCVSCHQALDPLASHLWVFHPEYTPAAVGLAHLTGCSVPFLELCYPFDPYRPQYDLGRLLLLLRPPGFYGQPSTRIDELGARVAADPRFASCTVRRFWSYLAEVPLAEVPFETSARLQQRFVDGGYSVRGLLHDIVTHPDFLAADATAPEVAVRVPGPLLVRPWQHAALVHQLTGFRWVSAVDNLVCTVGRIGCYGDVELAVDDQFGFRAMTGGTDGLRVLQPTHTPTPVKLLFTTALAEEAAGAVVRSDLAVPASERRLLGLVEADTVAEAAVRTQLAALHGSVLLEPSEPTSASVNLSYTLWSQVVARTGNPADGWRAVLAAMLQDPRILFY